MTNETQNKTSPWYYAFIGLVSFTISTMFHSCDYQENLDQYVQTVEYKDVNKDGLADVVVKGIKSSGKIFYATMENGTVKYLTVDQIKYEKEKQIKQQIESEKKQMESKLEQEIKNYKETK